MPGIKITEKTAWGIRIDNPFTTNLGKTSWISLTVSDGCINVAATGDLNADGLQALKQAIAIAETIQQRGYQG